MNALYEATKKINIINGFAWKKVGFATNIVPTKPINKIIQYLKGIFSFCKMADHRSIKKGVVISIGVKILKGIFCKV